MTLGKGVYWLLVFLLPTQIAYHFWPDYSYLFGIRIDYLSPAIYLTDILVFLLVAVSYSKIKHRIVRYLKTKKSRVILIRFVIITAVVVIANLFVAKEPAIALYKWIKIFEMFLLGLYVFLNKGACKTTLSAFYYSILFFSFIGIFQFLLQRSVGSSFYWLGERSFSVDTPGIALAFIKGRDFLRSYSTFPHPNAFAGFLGAGGVLVLLLNSQLKMIGKSKLWLFVLVTSTAFILTFSLGAIISGFLVLLYFIISRKKRYPVFKLTKYIFYAVVVLSLLTAVLPKPTTNKLFLTDSVILRIQQAGVAGKMFVKNPLFGVGLNNFIPAIEENISSGTSLFLQPVHNIYLLLLAETGTIGLAAFIYLTAILLTRRTNTTYLLPIMFVVFTGFFDHYWFTLQQNQLLTVFLLGIFSWKK
ncbi:MAG: O-antigen ligase family protein [bacterium]|nr:O-antigen ligase family protein [bacterium]